MNQPANFEEWVQTPELTKDFSFVLGLAAEKIYEKIDKGVTLDRAYIDDIIYNALVAEVKGELGDKVEELWMKYNKGSLSPWDNLLRLMEQKCFIDFKGDRLDSLLFRIVLPSSNGMWVRIAIYDDRIDMADLCPISQ